jgi:hypothetical protein
VVQAIDRGTLELHLGVRGRRATNDDEFRLGRASHPGHVFDGLQRIAARARHLQQLFPAEAALGDLARGGLDGGSRAELQRGHSARLSGDLHPINHRRELTGRDVFVGFERNPLGGGEQDVKPPRRERREMEGA